MAKADIFYDAKCEIGEGPFWDDRTDTLYIVDLLRNEVLWIKDNNIDSVKFDQNTGCIVPREAGGFAGVMQHGYYYIDLERAELDFICDPEADNPDTRFNDGKCDPAGRLWGGTMSKKLDSGYGDKEPGCALYCLHTDGRVETKLANVIQGNGMGWSPDNKKMYFIDTQRMSVQEFDFDMETGDITNGRVCVQFDGSDGIPDGMCVDTCGMLWVAMWGGGRVSRFDPATGRETDRIETGVPNTTCCAFGGKDGKTLFITTALLNTDLEKYPNAGAVFAARPGAAGAPTYRFKG